MTDEAFARAFERGEIPPAAFRHREHLRLAWIYLREGPDFDAALSRIRDGIQQFAAAAGASHKYHETITVFWMRTLDEVRRAVPAEWEFDRVAAVRPELTDSNLPLRHYSRERLFADDARALWVEPDLKIG